MAAAPSAAAAASAAEEEAQIEPPKPSIEEKPSLSPSLASYFGVSFYVFLTFLPKSYHSHISSLQSRNKTLSLKLFQAEDQIRQMKSRRKEDSKANAKVVEIFASHRNGWQHEEKKLLHQIDASAQEIVHLRTKLAKMEKSEAELRIYVEKLQREVEERDEMIGFMSRKAEDAEAEKECEIRAFEGFLGRNVQSGVDFGDVGTRIGKIRVSQGMDSISEVCLVERSSIEAAAAGGDGVMASVYGQSNAFGRDFVPSASLAAWTGEWGQDSQYDSHDPLFHMKHFVARRESPWKVDGESTGVSSKLKLLEQELLNLEKIGNGELLKVPSMMRKQARRYQALTGKIDDLCRRMQVSDPCEATLSSELRTQRQTEFLRETFRLQQRAIETGQKLTALHAETLKSYFGDDQAGQATRRSLQTIRSNFKEIQRNLEIWLARIMGDLEGILARDGASRVKDYYVSKYPFIRSVNQAA
ncbi:hypothetical protein MRB53_027243 [Persea americana]|uniref:Uncharacterized protein n=1 Tax=Persea americana TaxID=3435 RepID=A0ACC2LKF7_PERAE|nr:hypothetical protein MRB53_027243 [Persea americana]|eukprot:TRINITY_DN1979_c0_g1_i2.p1 TRINITY_DN1979_c0_g1~~TRINITY_DN1979_c0_g1_i2.p1  ORF type:complete len:471 (+),score=114.82 TRINITY_DN1979_c0_g1_i2:366-1778(+)